MSKTRVSDRKAVRKQDTTQRAQNQGPTWV